MAVSGKKRLFVWLRVAQVVPTAFPEVSREAGRKEREAHERKYILADVVASASP